jgi:multidrug resistance efflux pump
VIIMSAKPVIPTPTAQKWRFFRVHFVPSLVFLSVFVTVGWIWKGYIMPVSLVGKVETMQAEVASPHVGKVSDLRVTRFQEVRQGAPIVTIITTEPKVVEASLNQIRLEIMLIRESLMPTDNSQRNVINYEQLRLEWMRQRADLATTKVNLQLAEAEYQRVERLHKEQIVSDQEYDSSRLSMEALRKSVEEKTVMVDNSAKSLAQVKDVQDSIKGVPQQIEAAIKVQEMRLQLVEAQLSPIVLTSPIDGAISFIHRWSGETVAVGDPIVTISARHTDRIVGYLRQPLYVEPQTNMAVRVRTRGIKRMEGVGRILAVGAQLQPLNDIYLPPMKNANTELGLPILVSMPTQFKAQAGAIPLVHPGELVDLTILPKVQ